MKKLLITGFEPFGGESINPSWDAVSILPSNIGEYLLTKIRIPVIFGDAAKTVIKKAEEILPDVIICVGQAGGRDSVTPEFLGINLRHSSTPDNNGSRPFDQPIIADGECACFSTIPVRKISDAINHAGIPSKVSYSAGTFVCNDVLYTLLSHYKNSDIKVGFIHVPFSKEQGKDPSFEKKDIVKALTVAIESIDS